MKEKLPQFLIEELNKQYGEELFNQILNGYAEKRVVSLRVNTLKSNVEKVCEELSKNGIEFEKVSWSDVALVIKKKYRVKNKN